MSIYSLHNHSYYSLLKGTISLEKLIDFAKEHRLSRMALTDNNGMYGLIQFAKTAEENGIKPVLGTSISDPDDRNESLRLLAKNNSGYSTICKIITARKLKDDFKLMDVFKYDLSNVFVLTSSINLLSEMTSRMVRCDNLFAELIITNKQKKHTRELYNFCIDNSIKFCASHPAYFIDKEDYLIHRVVAAIRENKSIDSLTDDDLVDSEFELITPNTFEDKWKKLPGAIENTNYIYNACNVDLRFGEYKFPLFPMPGGESAFSYLWKICFKGLEERYKPISDKAIKRLQSELEVIDELGFSDYFLIVWDIVREARAREMLTIGRGSAANSLVAYCLGLTQVDPIEHNLYFERFLNRGRQSPPDVDLDFSWKERDEIIKYVFDKYGYDKVAMISTIVTFRARSAFRETAKAFGIADEEISKYSKFIPWTSARNLPDLANKFPEAKSLKFDEEPWRSIINVASKIGAFPRHLSIHPGGIVITPTPITNYVALEYAKNKGLGLIITQPDMYPIEDMGLVKIDLLSQRSLGVLRDTLNKLNDKSTQLNEVKNDR